MFITFIKAISLVVVVIVATALTAMAASVKDYCPTGPIASAKESRVVGKYIGFYDRKESDLFSIIELELGDGETFNVLLPTRKQANFVERAFKPGATAIIDGVPFQWYDTGSTTCLVSFAADTLGTITDPYKKLDTLETDCSRVKYQTNTVTGIYDRTYRHEGLILLPYSVMVTHSRTSR
jgi:hypothetical protein